MQGNEEKIIYFLTGASGVGKTTLVSELREKYGDRPWTFLHFDSIGVPSLTKMKEEFGSASGWQEAKAYEWIDRVIHGYHNGKIFLEGQVNLEFIRNGFNKHHFDNYKIILLHCHEEEMGHRLVSRRGQPELFNHDMRNWLNFLKTQAERLGAIIIDTTNLSKEEVLQKFEKAIGL